MTKNITEQEKIEVYFNKANYEEELKQITLNCRKANHCLDCIERITGNRLLISLYEIEKAITDKTGFTNIGASAELLNLYAEYVYLEAHLPNLETKDFRFDDNLFKIKESVLNKLKIENTTYLDFSLLEDYNNLKKAIEYLNKLSTPYIVNSLARDFEGKYKINLNALHNTNRKF